MVYLVDLLLGEIQSTTVYSPVASMPASAGIGTFSPTFSDRYPSSYWAFLVSSEIPSLFSDKRISYASAPVTPACSNNADCESFFFAGGLSRVSPNPYLRPGDEVIVHQEQGIQCEYWNVSSDEAPIRTKQCHIWGTVDGASAFRICIMNSSLNSNVLVASKFPQQWL